MRTDAVVYHPMGFAFGRAILFLFFAPHFRRRRKCGAKKHYFHAAADEKDVSFKQLCKSY